MNDPFPTLPADLPKSVFRKLQNDIVLDSVYKNESKAFFLGVAVRNSYTGRFTAASIWEILSLIVLLTRDPRRTSTHQLAEHEDCIKGE